MTKALHIAHIASSLDPCRGGTLTALRGMVLSQQAKGARVTVVATEPGEASPEALALKAELGEAGVRVLYLSGAKGPLSFHPDIKTVLAAELPFQDLVHIHGMWEDIQHQAAMFCRKRELPYCISPHGMLDPWSLSQSKWKKELYLRFRAYPWLKEASAIHCTSQTEAANVRALIESTSTTWFLTGSSASQSSFVEVKEKAVHIGPRRSLLIVEGLGVSSELMSDPSLGMAAKRARNSDDSVKVLFYGRLHPKKQPEYLIDALAAANARVNRCAFELHFYGPCDEHYLAELQKRSRERGWAESVHFHGSVSGEARLAALRSADIFALASQQENFGLSAAEAMSQGCPVLLSDRVDLCKDVEQSSCGWILSKEYADWSDFFINRFPSSAELLKRGDSARRYALVHYDWSKLAERWLDRHYPMMLNSLLD